MITRIDAHNFFSSWVQICNERQHILFNDWFDKTRYTAHILSENNSVIDAVAATLDLKAYDGYYFLDAIFFDQNKDLVPDCPEGKTWVRRIRVAFEHENYFDSGLFQELSHLLITDCDLRVLVTYTANENNLKAQFSYLLKMVLETDCSQLISESSSLLLIIGNMATS